MFESVRVARVSSPDVLVLGVIKPGKGKPVQLTKADAGHDVGNAVKRALAHPEVTGDLGQLIAVTPDKGARIVVVGLGDPTSIAADAMRAAGSRLGRRLAEMKASKVALELSGGLKAAGLDPSFAGRNLGEAIGLLSMDNTGFKGSATSATKREKLTIGAPDKAFQAGMKEGLGLADAANLSRRCSETPPNICNPAWMASQARALGRKFPSLSVRIIKGEALKQNKLNGLINVGKASATPPCLIRIEYKPSGKSTGKPAVFVGKTITYDTGGLSLKPPTGMRGMKYDMDGGAAVLGAMQAVAAVIKPKFPVVALLASAENSVSSNAYRPDDIIEYANGVTVEVTNTDAEGRLVMADALCWACKKEKPRFIVDVATLTGGVITALGSTYAGMWCDDDDFRAKVEAASARSGEPVWRLPLHREYRDMMKSDIADIVNSNANRKAHPIQGAAFLSYFVEDGVPWCHLDIAGMHSAENDESMCVRNTATGFGTRLLADLLRA